MAHDTPVTKDLLTPSVSIILPVYNLETLVKKSIRCCINQTFTDLEIVIVNDGSTDNSGSVIDEFCRSDPRIRHIKKDNQGLSFARKTGTEHARGKYVFHFDGDDTIPLNTIETLYKLAVRNDADMVAGDVLVCKENEESWKEIYSQFGSGSGVAFLEYILQHNLHYLWGKLIRRSLYQEHELEMVTAMKTVPAEDQVQMFQLCMYADRVTTVGSIVYEYRVNTNSITQKQIENQEYTKRQECYADIMYKLLNRFPYNDLIRQQINLRILEALYLGLHRTGNFVVNKRRSRRMLGKTLYKAVFSNHSALFENFPLTARCFSSLIYPKLAFKMKNL